MFDNFTTMYVLIQVIYKAGLLQKQYFAFLSLTYYANFARMERTL